MCNVLPHNNPNSFIPEAGYYVITSANALTPYWKHGPQWVANDLVLSRV